MVFIEEKVVKGVIYYYHSRNFRLNGKIKKISKYIGKEKFKAYNYKTIIQSIKELSQKEAILLSENISKSTYSFSNSDVINCIKNSLFVSQITQYDKNIKKDLDFLFNLNFIYNSNSIEGSKISFDDIKKIITGKKTNYKDSNEIQEVINSINCQNYLQNEFKFNLKSIKELHSILTKNLYMDGKPYSQGFKKSNIVVGFDSRPTTPPNQVKERLQELFTWYNKQKKNLFPLELAFNFYFKYEQIHPFEDGNGRTGRMIMNKILQDLGFMPLIIFSENSQSHHRAFVRGEKGNKKYFFDFMFKQYKKTFKDFYFKNLNY